MAGAGWESMTREGVGASHSNDILTAFTRMGEDVKSELPWEYSKAGDEEIRETWAAQIDHVSMIEIPKKAFLLHNQYVVFVAARIGELLS